MELPNRVASDLRIIAENIEPLRDAVEQLHILLEYVYRNREELASLLRPQSEPVILSTGEEVPFALSCACCHADSPLSQADAIAAGWTGIEEDPEGRSWNYLGLCPGCAASDDEPETRKEDSQDHPIRDPYEVLKSVVDKADGKPYVPLSALEKYLLTDQKLMNKGGKLTAKGKRKFQELAVEKQRENVGKVPAVEAPRKPKTLF
ncbi:MAG: hypothetical protein ACKVP0_14355 [Pirellulaceae bacterium]